MAQRDESILEIKYISPDSIQERWLTLRQLEAEFGPFPEVRLNTDNTLLPIKDSLRKAGVDTILVLQKKDNQWPRHFHYFKLVKGRPQTFTRQSLKKSEPAYIFRVRNGTYFVKKTDRFYSYKTLSDPAFRPYALFDFYFRNKAAIQNGQLLCDHNDTMKIAAKDAQQYYRTQSVITPQNYMYYPAAVNNTIPGSTTTIVSLITANDSIFFGVHDYETRALTPHGSDNVTRYANDDYYYYANQMLPGNIWIKMIESELLRIEGAGLWQTP